MAAFLNVRDETPGKLRIVVMGAAGVGKTTLISKFMGESCNTEYKGAFEEIYSRKCREGRFDVNVEVVEIRDGDSVPTLRKQSVADGDAFVLVYSVNDAQSFEYIYTLRDLILEVKGSEENVPVLVLANKLDIPEERKTPIWQVADAVVTIDWEHKYAEVSAKDGSMVQEVFQSVVSFSLTVYKDRFVTPFRRMTTPAAIFSRLREKLSLKK